MLGRLDCSCDADGIVSILGASSGDSSSISDQDQRMFCWNHLNVPDDEAELVGHAVSAWTGMSPHTLAAVVHQQCLECPQAVNHVNVMAAVESFSLPRLINVCLRQIEGHEIHFLDTNVGPHWVW